MLCSAKNIHFNISDETHMKMTPTEEIFEKTGTLHSKMLLSEFSNPFYCNKPELELNDSFLFFSPFFIVIVVILSSKESFNNDE
jgi:hypothetical protein